MVSKECRDYNRFSTAIILAMNSRRRSTSIIFPLLYLVILGLSGLFHLAVPNHTNIDCSNTGCIAPLLNFASDTTIEPMEASETSTPYSSTVVATLVSTTIPTARVESLTEVAQSYQANSSEQMKLILSDLGEEDASHIDGPLAMSMLIRAGLLPDTVNPHRFWLLDPLRNIESMERVFPRELYEWQIQMGSTREMDFNTRQFSLGDLIYLIPTNPQRLGKYVLVTRIDPEGRIFSTTNLFEPNDGAYRIEEIELYDPKLEDDSLFDNLGINYRGLLNVHQRSYVGQDQNVAALNRILNQGGVWQVVVKPVGEETSFTREADMVIHPASVIKVPLAMLVVKYLQSQDGGLENALLTAPPEAGRTYDQLLRAMLVLSEETATDILERDMRARMGDQEIEKTLAGWGAENTTLEPRRTTAREAAILWEGLFDQSLLGEQASQILLVYLAEITSGDTVRIWRLSGLLPDGSRIFNKRGSLTRPMVVADSGVVVLPDGKAYVICIFGEPDDWTGFEDLDRLIGDFSTTWYKQWVRTKPPD